MFIHFVKRPWLWGAVGLLLAVLGGTLQFTIPVMVKTIAMHSVSALDCVTPINNGLLAQQCVALDENSWSFNFWREAQGSNTRAFYFFNVTNAENIVGGGHDVIVNEIGPFVYEEKSTKHDIKFFGENRVSYRPRTSFTFVNDSSVAGDDLKITTANLPLLHMVWLVEKYPTLHSRLAPTVIEPLAKEGLFVQRTVRQMLFEGYRDVTTDDRPKYYVNFFPWSLSETFKSDTSVMAYTGKHNKHFLNTLIFYRNDASLRYWPPQTLCSSLRSAILDYTMMPPPKDGMQFEKLKLLWPHACRFINFRLNKDLEADVDHYEIQLRR